ncbi:MAG: PhzF family phenazine biosynthesis isomerase, partial [Myxococcota bacterium]
MTDSELFQLAAFAETAGGGNPAGVWIGARHPAPAEMQRLAAELGHSETAFVAPASGAQRTVRYFAPQSEVPFCGHATIATGVALGRSSGPGAYVFETKAGEVQVDVEQVDAQWRAAFRSVATGHASIPDRGLSAALAALRWSKDDL